MLNIEQYEYMYNMKNTAGVLVNIRDQKDVSTLLSHSNSIYVGSGNYAGIRLFQSEVSQGYIDWGTG